jgi:hypothetical protein
MTCSICKKDGHNKSSCGKLPKDPKPKPKAKEAPVAVQEEQEPDTEDVAMIRALATEVLNDLGAGHTDLIAPLSHDQPSPEQESQCHQRHCGSSVHR